jgi:spore maturation protein CgeB
MKLVVLGLSISSSWGNGHATTYRALLREFAARGHEVVFLERDAPWYAPHRDLSDCDYADVRFYHSLSELKRDHASALRGADAVIVGSYVPEGVAVGEWAISATGGITAFYDIDTPVTLAKLRRGDDEYLSRALIPRYDLYLSFTGGPTLHVLEGEFGAPRARALYCAVDTEQYYPEPPALSAPHWALGYLGTYSPDRQPKVEELLIKPAAALPKEAFVVAGPQYPQDIRWPDNVRRIDHLPPTQHRDFYNAQTFTLNVTRADMVAAGYSPSVRLFEAAACGTAIISDPWDGLDEIFVPNREIFIAQSADDVVTLLRGMSAEDAAVVGEAARQKVLRHHTARHRAAELEHHLQDCLAGLGKPPILLASSSS